MAKRFRGILVASVLVIGLTGLTGCSDGTYRYPCQDPANWETADCKPPICEVNGYCPVDLVGEDVYNGTSNSGDTTTSTGQGN